MGRRKNSGAFVKPSAKGKEGYSDQEDGDIGALHENEVDEFYDEAEENVRLRLQNSSNRGYVENVDEVFGLSDSDDDYISEGSKKAKKKALKDASLGDDEFDVDDASGRWGIKKKHFYGGNPNENIKRKKSEKDDENELDEAEVEEKESRFLQEKQLQNLTDEDFLLGAFSSTAPKPQPKKLALDEDQGLENVKLDLSKLSKKEKMRLFQRESPEFTTIVEDLDDKIRNGGERLQPVIDLMDQGVLPNEGPAAEYIRLKYQLTINYCANVGCYLMFKAKKVDLKMHPLTSRLLFYKKLLDELDAKLDPLIDSQISQICDAIPTKGGLKKIIKMVESHKEADKPKNPKRLKKPKKMLQLLNKTPKESSYEEKSVHSTAGLTFDEAMAVEFYGATKRKRQAIEGGSEAESEADEEHVEDKDLEEDQRRGITYEMSKNKGLQPKRSKIQRNPRVKHRKKFEKAKVRRKGQVREVRKETKKYAGEMSGINKRVKKGIKLS